MKTYFQKYFYLRLFNGRNASYFLEAIQGLFGEKAAVTAQDDFFRVISETSTEITKEQNKDKI